MPTEHDRKPFKMRANHQTPSADHYSTSGLCETLSGIGGSAVRTGISRMDGFFQANRSEDENSGSVSGGRECAPGSRSADGNPFGYDSRGADHRGPRFDLNIPPQGYGWWYADAISDDGNHGFSIIAMIGSVFSPYYAWSGRKNPQNHIGFNVGLYGKAGKRWTLTERGETALRQERDSLVMGPSQLHWDGECLNIHIDEWANPIPRKVEGIIRIWPRTLIDHPFQLDGNGKHFWQPFGAISRVEVEFSKPYMSWSGNGYMDCNWGSEPLENGFSYWDWSRAHTGSGAHVLYDAYTRDGKNRQLSLEINEDGTINNTPVPQKIRLKSGPIWQVSRHTLADQGTKTETLGMLEDTPFYTRSQIRSTIDGQRLVSVHESLDLDRFSKNWVRCLLPFRMPRRG